MEIDVNEGLQDRPARRGFLSALRSRIGWRSRRKDSVAAEFDGDGLLAELEDAVAVSMDAEGESVAEQTEEASGTGGLPEGNGPESVEAEGAATEDGGVSGGEPDDGPVVAEGLSGEPEDESFEAADEPAAEADRLEDARASIAALIAARAGSGRAAAEAVSAENGQDEALPPSEGKPEDPEPDEGSRSAQEADAVDGKDSAKPDAEGDEDSFTPVEDGKDGEDGRAAIGESLPAETRPAPLSPAIMRADGTPLPRHRLGEYVLHKGLITSDALDAASREQEVTGDRIGQILVANGFLSDKDRVEAILATSSERIAQESVAKSRIPSHLLDEYNIMISAETEDTVYVSTMFDEDVVRPIVDEYYGDKEIHFVSFLPTAMNGFIAAMKKSSAIDDASQTKETMLDRLLYRALNEGASDIHIIPRRKSYTAMLRLLGVRRIIHEGAMDEYKTMIAQVKDKARMDLAERRKPQDGGFQIEYSGKLIDLRVATLPTNDGEVCIMRVLDPDRVQPSLGQLGITDVAKWRKGFNQQHGLCLICGPTGSGKTTTLNSSIKEMDRFGKSIYTIEDPVEYRIPFTGQVSVNATVGLNFATAVRAFMRADPDVIVLGEVRDEETARNAIKAADTGHLVLATLHTGSILGSVSRLKDLGVAPRELRYLLRSVLVQSLVRTTCQACGGTGKHPEHADRSCTRCNGTRYAGRTVVSECEYFEDAEQVDRILDLNGDLDDVRTWPTMVEDAVAKYREGVTDCDELYRVFGASIEPVLRKLEESGT